MGDPSQETVAKGKSQAIDGKTGDVSFISGTLPGHNPQKTGYPFRPLSFVAVDSGTQTLLAAFLNPLISHCEPPIH